MQTAFTCHQCGTTFTPNWPATTRKKLRDRGYVFCSRSCGAFRHGGYLEKMPEYMSWNAMKTRCDNKTHNAYHRYGGRGITYDPEWREFKNFLRDMGKKPDPKMELDRIDNDKNYCKANCKWSTKKEQTRNRGGDRATRLYTHKGKTMCIKDWADYIGISKSALTKRLDKGWSLEKALSTKKHDKPDLYTYQGKTMTVKEWSDYVGIKEATLRSRLYNGYPLDKVFTNEKFNRWTVK